MPKSSSTTNCMLWLYGGDSCMDTIASLSAPHRVSKSVEIGTSRRTDEFIICDKIISNYL